MPRRSAVGAASKEYSYALAEEERDARIAAGAKLRSRPRLGQSGPLTGAQYSIRKEYAANAEGKARSAEKRSSLFSMELGWGKAPLEAPCL